MLNQRKILLVHPLGYRADAAGRDISRVANIMPPLGLASIAAYLEQRGIRADIVDCYARPDSDRVIRDYLLAERPAMLGLSCTTSSFLDGVRIAEMARGVLPGIRTVFGGPHVSALKTGLFPNFPAMDYAVVGEGEETMAELLLKGWDDPASVGGIIYRNGADAVWTGYRDRPLVLDELPFPAYEKLAGFPASYRLPIFNYPKTPNTSCISSRGCPYACSYCDRSVFRRSFRYNSAEYLYEHLRYLKERFGIRHINFYDDQFTFNRERVEKFTTLMTDRPLGMTFNCAVRAEHIDPELLTRMKGAGCWMMSLGIETGDEELLAQHRQNADLDHLAQKIRMIKDAGMRTKGLLMIGLPGETEQSIRKSMDYVFSLPIDDFNLAKFTPFPGSPVYEKIHELGEFQEDWEKMDCMNFLFVTKGMTRERLEELFQEFYRNHFKRHKVLWGYLTMLWRSPDSWLRFLGNLSSFLKFTRKTERFEAESRPAPVAPGAK
ncbi:B12-binding domain-containing radical SAM protein [Geomonas paludis]|uniref:B12-binding domain-containing radical SAM protein n=1 Tax=Geomonas paludis TaxID=2740185 RepID=A0A6V8MQY5_9BACT|nr:radical SAM protein [Geomonas paludis]UPU36056.1 B12-binding domain-containing radical SAM protein [Geomonas paludis]GFO62352.1 B12-binding domain-containing radical SAM protein [Geomonas paludis]